MNVLGIVFAGCVTTDRTAMSAFVRDTLGFEPLVVEDAEADIFSLPDGSAFAVASTPHTQDERLTIGFRVDDLEAAIATLHAARVETDGIHENARWRYTHFLAPDGRLYELVEER
jgi:catechol 2,3-dioxygenase-like lactoylglutathione lyase family enzyme